MTKAGPISDIIMLSVLTALSNVAGLNGARAPIVSAITNTPLVCVMSVVLIRTENLLILVPLRNAGLCSHCSRSLLRSIIVKFTVTTNIHRRPAPVSMPMKSIKDYGKVRSLGTFYRYGLLMVYSCCRNMVSVYSPRKKGT